MIETSTSINVWMNHVGCIKWNSQQALFGLAVASQEPTPCCMSQHATCRLLFDSLRLFDIVFIQVLAIGDLRVYH